MDKNLNIKATILGMATILCFSFSLHGSARCNPIQRDKVFDHYTGRNGGYVAVYTRNKSHGMFWVEDDIYVAGLIRVKGKYKSDGNFYPKRPWYNFLYFEDEDISQDEKLKKLAAKYLPEVTDAWFGGDTKGFSGCIWFY